VSLGTPGMDELVDFGGESIRLAGEEALSFYGRGDANLRFDERMITETELRLNQAFENRVRERFPEHQFFKENSQYAGYSHRAERYVWVFNALDGVANFQAGIPIWGISLALLENTWPIFGFFYMPATGDLFYALGGNKAFRGDTTIAMSSQDDINDESLLLAYARFHRHYRTSFPGKIRDFGCAAAHLCYMAMGRAEAALVSNESYRDLAAARIIVEAAGGKIYKMDGKECFLNEYLDGRPIHEDFLVARKETYPLVRKCLEKISS